MAWQPSEYLFKITDAFAFTNAFQEVFHKWIVFIPVSKIPYNRLQMKNSNLYVTPCLHYRKQSSDEFPAYKHGFLFAKPGWK